MPIYLVSLYFGDIVCSTFEASLAANCQVNGKYNSPLIPGKVMQQNYHKVRPRDCPKKNQYKDCMRLFKKIKKLV